MAVTATVPPGREARAQAVVNSGTGAGVVAGGLLVLAAPGQWRWAWAGFAVLALLVTWAADRRASWPSSGRRPHTPRAPLCTLRRPLTAAVLAGAGCATVWTSGRDTLADDGGLPAGVTGALWCVLGAAGLAGALSGDAVERVGLRRAWTAAVATTAVVLLAVAPGAPVLAGVALAGFGGAFVVLSGVLLAWGAQRQPTAAPQAAAVLFVGLTVGQAVGALALGIVADAAGAPQAFGVGAVLLVAAVVAAEPRSGRDAGKSTPVSSADAAHSRWARSGSDASGLRPASVGAPRSNGPEGPA
jgi:predicted MFS family arabinose efflux permease